MSVRSWRRRLGVAVVSLGVVGYVLSASPILDAQTCTLPSSPASSGIDHIIVIMMENRSFDHFMGWLPNSWSKQNETYSDGNGNNYSTYSLSGNYTAGTLSDPDHAWGNLHDTDWFFNGIGPNLGWLMNGQNTSHVAIGYYGQSDLGFLGQMAQQYTTLDEYFSSILSQTWPNRKFAHAAQTDTLDNTNSGSVSGYTTIWDRLAGAGVSASYYPDTGDGGNNYLSTFFGSKYANITKSYAQFLSDAQGGTLPSVAFVDPGACDDHPGDCDILQGDAWIKQTVSAVMNSPQWLNSVVVVTFDEDGGFFDHVPPTRAAAPNGTETDTDVNGKVPLGFRVPTVVISPFTVGQPGSPTVNHLIYDHTSALKLIEWRFGLNALTARDASTDINNLACAIPAPNLLGTPGFEQDTVPSLGPPGWVSDSFRQTAAKSDTTYPHTGTKDGICSTSQSLDCGMYQDLTAPTTGTYTYSVYANANKTGGLVGANVNGNSAVSQTVQERASYGAPYVMSFSANAGDTIRVWMYAPNTPGYVVIDDSVLTVTQPNLLLKPGFEEYSNGSLGAPGWVSDTYRQSPAVSSTSNPHSGTTEGLCSTQASLDCGIYQDVTAPLSGSYAVTFYANSSRSGALIGANVNGSTVTYDNVQVRNATYGAPYTMTFTANAGDTIRVWMYSPASNGWAVIDDVSLIKQ